MQDEQSFQESQELYESMRELIDTLEETPDSKSQISGIFTLLRTITGQLEANDEMRFHQNEMLENHSEMLHYAKNTAQIQDDSLKAQVKIFSEYDDKISQLANLVTEIANNSAKFGEQIKGLAENAAKIPVIDVDNLLKTLNEHADEINQNTASIKEFANKLKN